MGSYSKLHAFLLSAVLAIPALTVIPVQAQEEEEERRFADTETTRVRALSQSTARDLEPVRAALAPEPEVEGGEPPEPNPEVALDAIQEIDLDDLQSHERAEVFNLYGYIYYLMQDTTQAKRYYQNVIDEPEANRPLVIRTMKTLAQLHMMDEEYAEALDLYLDWMSYQEIIGPNDYALVASIYFSMEDYDNALQYIERAIGMREENGEVGQENWYSIQRSVYYFRGDYQACIEILKKLIVYYPNVRYWREMGGMYAELEMEDQQMAAYDLAWLQGGLTTESQVVGMAYMHINRGAPYQGAEVLIQGIEDGTVEPSGRNLQIIGSAFYQANAMDRALEWMERAAEAQDDGETFGRLASILVDLGRYEEAHEAALAALDQGGLDRPDLVRLQAGNALFNLYRYDEALSMFRSIDDERSEDTAQDWIRYVESEASRERQLRASGIDIDAIRADIQS